jgi:hypothetical protein
MHFRACVGWTARGSHGLQTSLSISPWMRRDAVADSFSCTSRHSMPPNQAMQLTASKPAVYAGVSAVGAYAAWHAQRARGS